MFRQVLWRALHTHCSLETRRRLSGQGQGAIRLASLWKSTLFPTIGAAFLAGTGAVWIYKSRASCTSDSGEHVQAGEALPDLPDYKLEEVAKHKSAETGIWVIYKDGVYDITEFLEVHPGGSEKIVLAAGASIEPYWEVYASHKADKIKEILESLRIGNVHPSDRGKLSKVDQESFYANEPVGERSPILQLLSQRPYEAETPMILLSNSYLTPSSIFFVRNHLPVPLLDPIKYVLKVKCQGQEPVQLTLEDLRTKFSQHTITSTIHCTGNRRSEMAQVKPLLGKLCDGGFMGTARWVGPRLRDILVYAGMKESEEYTLKHVHLEGLDNDPLTGERYGVSIPIEKAMDPRGDCLVALEMNGEPLPRDHGYPVRAVVPGVVGARNVKWLGRVEVHKDEHPSLWQQKYYKGFPPSVDWDTADFSAAPAIQEYPVTSLICSPQEGATMNRSDEVVTVKGVAWSGGGREVIRVDVSSDGGKTWQPAELINDEKQPLGQAWAWKRWETTIPLPKEGNAQLCCKAIDISYNIQPDTVAPIWNAGGYVCNAWHRVDLTVK